MPQVKVTHYNKPFDKDTLRIKGKDVQANVNILKFVDADTLQVVYYVPSLDITGYGETEQKASEMCNFSALEYLSYLSRLPSKKKEQELRDLGWKSELFKNKEFSKAFINGEGKLENFNAMGGKVERLTLETV